jgi:hypothetical protein
VHRVLHQRPGAALKIARPIQFKENIALVLKYFDKLAPLMQEVSP